MLDTICLPMKPSRHPCSSSTFAPSKFLTLFAGFPLLVIIIASSFQTDIVNHRQYTNLRVSADYTGETYTIGDEEFDVYTRSSPRSIGRRLDVGYRGMTQSSPPVLSA